MSIKAFRFLMQRNGASSMQWLQAEYMLKGIYLGLLLFVALRAGSPGAIALAAGLTFGGLAVALALAAYRKIREGFTARGRPFAFLLFLLLESPELVYAGIILGLAFGALLICGGQADNWLLGTSSLGGAVLGLIFYFLRYVRRRETRLGLSLLVAALLVFGLLVWFGQVDGLGERLGVASPLGNPALFGAQLLLGIPLFYLLTFAGREEESEIEIGAVCAALGLGVGMLVATPTARLTAYLAPIVLYFAYTLLLLPRLRVFKHTVRGFSYGQIGRYRQAILSFRRALHFDPQNALAREGLWSVHRAMDLSHVAEDPETLAVVDLDMCLERASALLLQTRPSPEKVQEAQRLLELVRAQRPQLMPVIRYWRAVANTHARLFDEAAADLEQLLDPDRAVPGDPQRRSILLLGWQLAARLHPELTRRVGMPQLAQPGRRLEAIGAVERYLADKPEDAEVWGFKRFLYQDLTEREYETAAARPGGTADFNHAYAHQLGLALIGDADRWQRGAEYLRIAARGLPAQAPSIFSQIALACQKAGKGEDAWRYYELAIRAGRAVGPKNLQDEDRQAYFAAAKLLGEAALAHNHLDAAIDNLLLYTECERSGLETLRTLATLYEKKGDPLSALRVTEQALLYNNRDADFLERKDRYYYSVMPGDLPARLDSIRSGFDVGYCLRKARGLLDSRNLDLDLLDWGQHLAELVRVVEPENLTAKVLVARARLRRGEKEEAVALLEEVRSPRPEKFATGDDEDAWYLACKLLGEIYLYELGKPDQAVECFKTFRESAKSGADTMYKLGQAYEQLGDRARAVKFYKHVVSYDNHPLAPEAYDALHRLQAN
jgi:tetratricopeptide (TPR) repeat protein